MKEYAGATVMIDDQGFKYVDFYHDKDTLEREWLHIDEQYNIWLSEQEEE